MAQNITLMGASYSAVPSVLLPKTGGGTAQYDDTTLSTTAAAASDITQNKQAWVNGVLLTGTNSGGSSKNIQYMTGRYEVSATSYTATSLQIKVSKAGTYKCYWSMDRNTTSGTTGSRLYKGTTALGTAHTSWTYNNNNRNGQACEETLTFAKDDTITVRARSRSTSYICGVMNFFIVEQ